MNILSFLIFLTWLVCSYFVVRFVLRTGGTTKIGHVAHWFGGAFTMIGLAVGMTWVFAKVDGDFGNRVNVYILTHQPRPAYSTPLIQQHSASNLVTVYRQGSVNTTARLDGGQLTINESQTIRTSLWWMLWDTKYPTQ